MGDQTGEMSCDQVTQSLELQAEGCGLDAVGHGESLNTKFSVERPSLVFPARGQHVTAGRDLSSFKPSPFI